MSITLGEQAAFISSKNAGPFLVTVDIVLSSRDVFLKIRDSELLTAQMIADLYKRDVKDIVGIYYFNPANAIKVTMRRPIPSGSPSDSDVYGAQQHVPLMLCSLPIDLPESSLLGERA